MHGMHGSLEAGSVVDDRLKYILSHSIRTKHVMDACIDMYRGET